MTWVRIDDRAPTHPKSLAGDIATFGLWVAGLCYCNLHRTGGFIARTALRSLLPSDKNHTRLVNRAARELVETGRWVEVEGGWKVHGYQEEQAAAMPPAEPKKRRRSVVATQRSDGEASEKRRRSVGEASEQRREASEKCISETNNSGEVADSPPAGARDPGPARPDPIEHHPQTPMVVRADDGELGSADLPRHDELDPAVHDLVAEVRSHPELAPVIEPLEVVQPFVDQRLADGVSVDGLKRSVAEAAMRVRKARSTDGRAAVTPDRVVGILVAQLKRTARREQQERDQRRRDEDRSRTEGRPWGGGDGPKRGYPSLSRPQRPGKAGDATSTRPKGDPLSGPSGAKALAALRRVS